MLRRSDSRISNTFFLSTALAHLLFVGSIGSLYFIMYSDVYVDFKYETPVKSV